MADCCAHYPHAIVFLILGVLSCVLRGFAVSINMILSDTIASCCRPVQCASSDTLVLQTSVHRPTLWCCRLVSIFRHSGVVDYLPPSGTVDRAVDSSASSETLVLHTARGHPSRPHSLVTIGTKTLGEHDVRHGSPVLSALTKNSSEPPTFMLFKK